jgi:hypothetical protein
VLVVEYLDAPEDVYEARRLIEERGFIPHIAQRALDRLTPQPVPPAAAVPASPGTTSSVKPTPKR